jgi:hypothetical protein
MELPSSAHDHHIASAAAAAGAGHHHHHYGHGHGQQPPADAGQQLMAHSGGRMLKAA